MRKAYKKWVALSLSAVMLAGNFGGFLQVEAEDITGENLLENPGFENDKTGWDFGESGSGVGTNNKHSGTKHFYLDGATEATNVFEISQEIKIPAEGTYQASVWAACGGENGTFGVRKNDGTVLKEVVLSGNNYKEYTINEGLDLKQGDVVEVYVKEGSAWINGDDFQFVCTKQTGDGEIEPDYIFEGNMIKNGECEGDDNSITDWTVRSGGTATNNGYPSGDRHYYLNGNGYMEQEITVPYTGTYTVSTWTSASGKNGVFGVKTLGGQDIEKVELANGGGYKYYEQSVSLEKGDSILIYVQGSEHWTNGDKFSLTFNKTEFNNLLINPEFDTEKAWKMTEATIADGQATLANEASEISQDFYVPLAGPYIAEVVLENADNAAVSLGERKQTGISGSKTVQVKLSDLKVGDKITAKVSGKADVKSFTVKFDLEAFVNTKPTASEVKVGYESEEEDILVGTYKYTDAEDHQEGKTTYQWYASETKDGEYKAIPEATEITYQVADEYKEQYIKFEVVPVDEYTGQGEAVRSEALDPVALNIKKFETTPKTYDTEISVKDRSIYAQYTYETDLSKVELKDLGLPENVRTSVKAGDVLDLTKDLTIEVSVGNAKTEWKVTAEASNEKKVVVRSSNDYLEETFNWAAQKQRQFVMTGKTGPINVSNNNYEGAEEREYIPSYWAGYYDRTAFYGRDFVHQATGGQIAGLEEENYSMFEAFAKQCTESRKYYTLWALNFDGSPYTVDYHNDNYFVREIPAQFELVEKAYEQYLWSGDERYIEDETMWEFYTNVMTKYVELHDENGNGVADEVGTGIFDGSCTYNERGRHVIEAGDAIGSQYQATLAYAAMLKARGESEEAEKWYQKAADLKKYFNEEWSKSDNMDSGYVCAWGPNGEKYSDFSKETSWFMPMKLITEPGERNDEYIDFVVASLGNGIGDPNVSTEPNNLEAYTYIPDMLFPYNRSDEAWKWMQYITSIKDEPHERPIQGTNGDYPEISFTFVSHTIEGMMGVEPDAGQNFIATVPRLPKDVPDVTAKHIDIGDSELELTHVGNTASTLTNTVGDDLTWEVRFYGDHKYIKVNGEYVEAKQKDLNGEAISYVTTTVKKGATVNAQVASETPVTTYTIKAEAGENGKISPSGEVEVGKGETQTFVMTPNKGYEVADVLVDGKSESAVTEYTFENVTEDHNIEVSFKKVEEDTDTGEGEGTGGSSSGDQTSGEDQDPDNDKHSQDEHKADIDKAAKTGDTAQPFILVGLMGIAVAVIVFFRKKRA